MSVRERERSHLVRRYVEGGLSQREASERLGIGVRQFKPLVRAWRAEGDAGLVSRQRGRASNRRLKEAERERIETLLRGKYQGFGPTPVAEKLLELDGIKVSAETLQQMQIRLGLWRARRRARRVFQVRDRREWFGELIQIDGSPHDWFEGRVPRCTLIVFIDGATADGAAVCSGGDDACVSGDTPPARAGAWRSAGVLFGSAWHLPRERQAGRERRRQDRVWSCGGASRHCLDHSADTAGEGARGTGEPDVAGSAGQGDAAARDCVAGG